MTTISILIRHTLGFLAAWIIFSVVWFAAFCVVVGIPFFILDRVINHW